ncbi:ABC transporter permease [Cypionkella sp.]|jgi:spermidine/putrescine transport system permease protein|uniref:ABC transporter permease n=1 Tax=Cypionkella sp. TaxID=2811411 RepID=UPI002764C6BE|nr:ABC transporter permease [Cypionkella sp.]
MYQFRQTLARVYAFVFILYLLIPLGIMGAAAFNDNKTPSIVPWKGVTGKWFDALFADETMWLAFRNTLVVAVAVSLLAVLVGTAAAILINSISGRLRTTLYGLMISTLLIPGAVIGISTMIMWTKIGNGIHSDFILFKPGLHLSVLGQVSYIAAMVMLLVLARLQSFDEGLEEAALDLGASHAQVMRRILLPYLYPAIGAGGAVAFFQSIENYNVTQFTRGGANTLTVYVFSKVRSGITPTINALALMLMIATLALAIGFEINRRRKARIEDARQAEARRATALEEAF